MHVLYMVALLGGGILLIGLISKKNKHMALLPKEVDDANIIEGFKKIKIPSVDDIAKPIKKSTTSAVKGLGKDLKKSTTSAVNGLGKQIKGIEKQITSKLKMLEKKILGGFNSIFNWIKQGISFLIFFPQCFLWYSIHMFGYVLYAPIAFFVWVFSLQSIEKMVFKTIEFVDKQVYQVTGVHIFQFSDNIQARCYFSKSKLREIREKRRARDSSSSWDDPDIDDSDVIGYLVLVVSILVALGFAMIMVSN